MYYVLLVIRYSIINVLLTCSLRSGNLPCRCDARRFRPCTHSCTFDHFCYKVSDEKFDTAVPGRCPCLICCDLFLPTTDCFEQMDFPQAHPPHFLTLFRNSVSSLSTLSSCIRPYGSKPLSLSAKLQCTIHRYKPCTIVGETPTKVNMSLLSIFNF